MNREAPEGLTLMNKLIRKWSLLAALALAGAGIAGPSFAGRALADQPANQQVAAVEQLKSEAYKSLRAGKFDQTNELIAKAAAMNVGDPSIAQMSGWVHQFESQRQAFAGERKKEYDKAVADVRKLIDHQKETYAADAAARAFSLADDKDKFH